MIKLMHLKFSRACGLVAHFGVVLGFVPFLAGSALGTIITPDRIVPWVPGVTVGLSGGVPLRTNLLDVTKSPYNADPTGVLDAASSIQAAMNGAQSNDVIYLPAGTYTLRASGLSLNKSGVTVRGAGSTVTKIVGLCSGCPLSVGQSSLQSGQGHIFSVASAIRGSTNITLGTALSQFGGTATVGDTYSLSTKNTSDRMQVISVAGFDGIIKQPVCIASVSGTIVTITTPLVWDFTNSASMEQKTAVSINGYRPIVWSGVENLSITLTNNGEMGTSQRIMQMSGAKDCWVRGCSLAIANNYNLEMTYCVNCEVSSNNITGSASGGSNHGGLLVANDSGLLIENNIFDGGLSPAIEFNDGFCGNAVFANFFTNNTASILCHNSHPLMNLFEANICNDTFEMDGYFGSASHQTLFRNRLMGTTPFKRFITYMQVVGNVCGSMNYNFSYMPSDVSSYSQYGLFELGWPNIGNNSFDNTSRNVSWNWPGPSFWWTDNSTIHQYQNGSYTFTNNQLNTNILWGNFTNIPAPVGSIYPIIFQDGSDTNKYWGATNGGVILSMSAGTISNLVLNMSVSVSNRWTIYVAGQNNYQWLQLSNRSTMLLHGNYVYTNRTGALVWDPSIADHDIQASLLYTNGAPIWWGTNAWPAIGPDRNPVTGMIPAQERFLGLPIGKHASLPPPGGLRVVSP
ncbi:MAG: glycosyl hydrolase family 28-related protein [Verrucomicrobiota bacterium]